MIPTAAYIPDFAVVTPVFARGRPLALAATITCHQDVAVKPAGSVPSDSTKIFLEGIRTPAVVWARGSLQDCRATPSRGG